MVDILLKNIRANPQHQNLSFCCWATNTTSSLTFSRSSNSEFTLLSC
ncbi:hypothetical protein ECH_0249 [Ehrlichia chaffeensis str. Arkansas]|uniref:Uncharacterized protein n=1 Tax=Ehrlichia chaffeensis (strain ATCC CRL-10679 / Arkansas) TaxID=205920 RepID=Q2GHL3_EHRCR|nr:hypothetical protein ECH_0249 [Ehrlichia chaffeensis str. Arkansas]